MDSEPLDEVQWRAPEWIQTFGLRSDNVLEYFAQSPFYDRSSNNQVLKMQSQFNDNFYGRQDLQSELKNMKGIEFVVALAREPDLWIIRKQSRLSPQEVRCLATYFVVGENIYMAPSIYSILASRMLSISLALNKSIDRAMRLPSFRPSQGYSYPPDHASIPSLEDAATTMAMTATPSGSASAMPTPAVNKKTPKSSLGGASTYASPAPGTTTGTPSATGGPISSSATALRILEDKERDRSIEYALAFTVSNSAMYLDTTERDVGVSPSQLANQEKRKTASAAQRRMKKKADVK